MQTSTKTRRLAALSLAGATLLAAAPVLRAQTATAQTPKAQTQPGGDLQQQTAKRVNRAFDGAGRGLASLHLTDAQKAELRAIAKQNLPAARSIMADKSLTAEQKRTKLLALRGAVKGVLTPAQQQQAEVLRGQALTGAIASLQWVSDQLELTPDQQGQIRDIVVQSVSKGTALRTQNAAGKADFTAVRGLLEDTHARINDVLTPQQRSKWAVMTSTARRTAMQRIKEARKNGQLPFADKLPVLQ